MVPDNVRGLAGKQDPLQRFNEIIENSNHPVQPIFDRLDADRNGKVTYEEFKKGVKEMNFNLSENDIRKIIRKLD